MGTLQGELNASYTIQFFANTSADLSGYGQGQTYLGQTVVKTNASGAAMIDASVLEAPAGESVISATATDSQGNTSEFSQDASPSSPTSPLVVDDNGGQRCRLAAHSDHVCRPIFGPANDHV